MPRPPRYLIIDNNSLFHVTWQCHNQDFLLEKDWAKKYYYDLLLKYKDKYQIKFFSYCFMSNHPHLLGHCADKKLFSDFFRIVNSQFARFYNKQMNRRGQVVMDRFKSPRISDEKYLVNVMHYIEMNPVKANIVKHPRDFKWSSFHYYAYGHIDPLLTPAPCYLWLGSNNMERQTAYLKLVSNILKIGMEKKNYSVVNFIGDPFWVVNQKRKIEDFLKNKNELKEIAAPPEI